MAGRPQVVVVGGGFGGITACRHLADLPVDVTLVDRNNFHTFQPLLYQVATAGLDTGDVAYSLRSLFRRAKNVRLRLGTVVRADPDAKVVHLDDGRTFAYDYLVVGAGAETNYFGIEGAEAFSLPMKTLDEAVAVRNHILRCFEEAAAEPDRVDDGWLEFVIVGGGPTGVELSGGLVALHKVLEKDYHHLDVGRARVRLIEAGDALLAPFSEKSQRYTKRSLEAVGVDVMLGRKVEKVTSESVTLDGGEVIACRTVVWAGGVRAQSVADGLGLPQTHGARVEAGRDCQVKGYPGVFAIGDLGAAADPKGHAYPQLAQPAIQQGRHVGHQIGHLLEGRPTTPFKYLDKGIMATIGRNKAVCELPNGWRFQGFVAWLAWLGLHLGYLTGLRNRLNVLVDWLWGYVTYDRASRLITDEPGPRPGTS
jgi:NADH dehydrogenase